MMRYFFALFPFVLATCFIHCGPSSGKKRHEQVKQLYTDRLTIFSKTADSLVYCIENNAPAVWQQAFNKAREAYKHIEIFTDYYYPSTAKALNGPPVAEVEADDPIKEFDPSGFQVMEESLFPGVDTLAKKELVVQAKMIQSLSKRLQNGLESLQLSDAHVFDALRLQLLRIISVGLAGADNSIAQNSVAEAVFSIKSFEEYLSVYVPDDSVKKAIGNAATYLSKDNSFVDFNRAEFFVDYIKPLWTKLHYLQTENQIRFLKEMGLANTSSLNLFDSAFFNPASFSQYVNEVSNPYIVRIGEKLFLDNRLSGNGNRSCASCHQPQQAYADNLPKNSSVDGEEIIFRNTPTILYSSLQPVQFADGRLSFLEDQAKAVIENHSEMKGDMKKIVLQLSNDSSYQTLMQQAFSKPSITEKEITKSLAAFIRTKASFQSSFDKYLQGNKAALTSFAVKGFALFMGKGKCGTCHFMPLFSGVVPPHFSKMESEVIGVPLKNNSPFLIDGDEGKWRLTGAAIHRFAFKTPTLRNIALTAPYMHNGVYKTLDEVLEFYDKGGGAGIGISLPNQTLPAEPLNLGKEEKMAIIEFLKSLNDK